MKYKIYLDSVSAITKNFLPNSCGSFDIYWANLLPDFVAKKPLINSSVFSSFATIDAVVYKPILHFGNKSNCSFASVLTMCYASQTVEKAQSHDNNFFC